MATYTIVSSGTSPLGANEILAGSTITVSAGDIFIFAADADAKTIFESTTVEDFQIQFNVDNTNNFEVEIKANLNPDITIADTVNLDSVFINAKASDSSTLTVGDDASLSKFEGSNLGTDTVDIGDNFSTTNDLDTFGGDDQITIGSGASLKDLKTGDGIDTVWIGAGLDVEDIDLGDGTNSLTLGANTVMTGDIKTGSGPDSIFIGDSFSGKKIDLGDGSNAVTIGNNATLTDDLKTGSGADSILIGDDFSGKDINLGDGNNAITIGDGATLSEDLETGSGVDTIEIGSDFLARDIKTGDGNDAVDLGNDATIEDLDTGKGDDEIVIGDGLVAEKIDTHDGADEITIGDDATIDDLDTGDGDDAIAIGDGLVADKIDTHDGADEITIGDDANVNEIDSSKQDDTIVVGDNYTGDKLEADDGDDFVSIGTGAVINDLDGGKGTDTLSTSTPFPGATNFENVVCFARGTWIAVEEKDIQIENLEVGDLVMTVDHGLRPIKWIGSVIASGTGSVAPIMIAQGALGNDRDLWVSPQHRILLRSWRTEIMFGEAERFAAAKHLTNGNSIQQVEVDSIEYFHILFDQHEIIYANGAECESLHLSEVGIGSMSDENREEILSVYPGLESDFSCFGPTARTCLKGYEAELLALELADEFPGSAILSQTTAWTRPVRKHRSSALQFACK